jgi:hypothetical protein
MHLSLSHTHTSTTNNMHCMGCSTHITEGTKHTSLQRITLLQPQHMCLHNPAMFQLGRGLLQT